MAQILNEKKRICRIANNTVLPELHCISGPIRRAKLTHDEIVRLVRNGRVLFEIDPEGKLPEVRLTTANCTIPQFEKEKSKEEKPVQAQAPQNNQNQNQNKGNFNGNNNYNKKDKYNKYNQNKPQESAPVVEEKTEAPATDDVLTSADV